MAYLFPNFPPFFLPAYKPKRWLPMDFSIYPFGYGENGRMIGLVFIFFPLALFPWYLVVVGWGWWFIRWKSRRPTHIYVWITFLLFAVPFMVWFRFGSGVYLFYSQFRLGKYRDFVLFFFPFLFTLLFQYTLLLATAAAYLSLSSSSLLIVFLSPFFLHCFLRVNHPLLYLLIPMNNHPLYCGGHSSSSPFPPTLQVKNVLGALPFSLLGVISCEWMNACMVLTWRGCILQ